MKSNFDFLYDEWQTIYERSKRAEEFAYPDIRASYVFARMSLELIYEKDFDLEKRVNANLDELINNVEFNQKLGSSLKERILEIKSEGNNAVHNNKLKYTNPIVILKNLFEFTKWISNNYSENEISIIDYFDKTVLTKKSIQQCTTEELQELEKN